MKVPSLKVHSVESLKDSCLAHLKSVQSDMATLQIDRTKALDAYLSRPQGNEIEGRSQFVTSDLSDVVTSIIPTAMKIFFGSKNIASILPMGPEDEEPAKLLEELVNWQFTTQMPGYQIMENWFYDALLQKIGVVKYWWEESEEYKHKEYEGLTEPEYLKILQEVDAGLFIIDKEEVSEADDVQYDEFGQVVTPATVTYEVEGRKVIKKSGPMCEVLPPEEFLFNVNSKSIDASSFCCHKKRVHKSYLSKYDVSEDEITAEFDSFANDLTYLNRFQDLGGTSFLRDETDEDYVYIYECYLPYYDAEGHRIPYQIVILGNKVISAEENKYGRPPFCALTALTIPHRLVGRDMADMVVPIQSLNTYFTRQIVDSAAWQNNGMKIINPFRVNMEDVLADNTPGAVWRTKYDTEPSRCYANITPTPLGQEVFAMPEKLDMMRQERTGITKYSNGTDSKSLNRTASGISQIMGAANERKEGIYRGWAEGGVKQLFQAFIDMNLDFFDTTTAVKVNKEWKRITPDMIDGKFDVVLDIGSSFGAAEIKTNQILQMINTYAAIAPIAPIPAKYFYSMVREVWSQQGYKNVDAYAPSVETIVNEMTAQVQAQAQVQQSIPQPPMPQEQAPPEEPGLEVPPQKLTPEVIRQELMHRGIING